MVRPVSVGILGNSTGARDKPQSLLACTTTVIMGVYGATLLAACLCVSLVHDAAGASRRDYLNLLRALQYNQVVNEDPYIRARCDMRTPDGFDGPYDVHGTVTFKQLKTGGSLSVNVKLTGLDVSSVELHGFHVHQYGDLSDGCTSTGGHYNPFGKDHGGPQDTERHIGDLGNVQRNSDGSVNTDFTDDAASLLGSHTIIGRAIVLHKDTDDLGRGGYPDSLTTGHAGARVACCIINEVII